MKEYNGDENDKQLFMDREITRINEREIPELCGDGITVSIHKTDRTDEQRVREPLIRVRYKDIDELIDGNIFYYKSQVEKAGIGSYYVSVMPDIKAEIKRVINEVCRI